MASLKFGSTINGFTDRNGNPVPVTPVSGPSGFRALTYQCILNVDWDGAHRAYGWDRPDSPKQSFPHQKNLQPWERWDFHHGSLQNARAKKDNHWVGVFAATPTEAKAILRKYHPYYDALEAGAQQSIFNRFLDTRESGPLGSLQDVFGKFPVVQLPEMDQPEPGYYVSISNAHTDSTLPLWKQQRYWDAGKVPFAALPVLPGVRLGDFGLIISKDSGCSTPFFFGDTGGGIKLGESSGYVYLTFSEKEDRLYNFIVFPGSGNGSAEGDDLPANMQITVKATLGKIKNTGSELVEHLIPRYGPDQWHLATGLWEWNGPGDFGNPPP
jgi:hypothetical protein